MSKKSTPKTPDSSGDRLRAADIDKARSAVKLQRETDSEDVESRDETRSYELNESETSEHLYTSSSIEGLFDMSVIQEVSTDSEAENMEDVQDVWEKEEEQGLSQLHLAAERGDTEAVRCLLNVDVLDTKHNTPLHVATLNGHVDVVNLLLSKNASVNSRNAIGQTSLHLAAKNGHFAIVQLLLDSNADVHITDQSNNTPIHIAAMHGHYELVRLLMSHSVLLICYGNRPLHLAAKCGHTDVVQLLLNYGENPDATNLDGDTPLHLASENGHFEVVEVLLRNNADPNIRNAYCKTPLHVAAKMDHAEIVKTLIDHEGEVNAVTTNGDTALHYASQNGHFEVVEVLLRKNADANIRNASCKTPLHIAAEKGYAEILKALIDHEGEVNAVDRNGNTALHYAACNGHFEVAEVLLMNNADPNIRNASCNTPLHIAAEMGFAELVKAITDHHGKANVVDTNGNTALHLAASNGHSAVVNVLLNQTAKRDARISSQPAVNQIPADELGISQRPIINTVDVDQNSNQIVAEGCNVEIADTLLSNSSSVNAVFEGQATPLYLAVEHGHADTVENLILNGTNVNACNNAKMTALHLACQNGHTSIVEILLDNHAIVDVTTQSEETPFYLAAKNGHAAVSDLLIRRCVYDFVQTLSTFDTPLLVAVRKGHTDVVEVILKHCRISGKLSKEGYRLQENDKNLVETSGITTAELLKGDGRRISAGIVWREQNTPLEIRTSLMGGNALEIAKVSIQTKMVRFLLSGDQCIYSEKDLFENFRSFIKAIDHLGILVKDLSDLKQQRLNVREFAQVLISKFDTNYRGSDLSTLLHDLMEECIYHRLGHRPELLKLFESLHNHVIDDLINLLLEKGADFNMKNSDGKTPLIIACEQDCCRAIQILFEWEHKSGIKLDLDARDRYGATALIKAAEGHNVSIVRLLLNHKASVNLYDNYGFTALHAAIYEPNTNWFDLHFFCKWLLMRKADEANFVNIGSRDKQTWKEQTVDPYEIIDRLRKHLECNKKVVPLKEEIIKLLLDNDETNVNATDFRGNTPLDLAVMSSKRINSEILSALKHRGAIRNSLEPEDEAPIEVARVDERGRNPLHRLMLNSDLEFKSIHLKNLTVSEEQDCKRFDLMVYGILLRPENFRESATAADYKGRTPLHYAVMSCLKDSLTMLLKLGSNVNAADMYGKAPLHYATRDYQYELLVQFGANENLKDKHGNTPGELKQLQKMVFINRISDCELPIGETGLFWYIDIAQVLNPIHVGLLGPIHVTELSKRKLIETIRIYSQSPRPQESSEEAIWKIWTENEPIRLNRRLSQLTPLVHQFIQRLASGIKEKDWRFECQPILVGSADEETKAVMSGDFDFNLKMIKFSQLCDPFPHPQGPKGYFQLRRKPSESTKSRSHEKFDSFFNLDECLLTNEVNSRFKIILKEVLSDPAFWQDEHLFDWNVIDKYKSTSGNLDRLCKTVQLRMIHPIEDGDGGFLFGPVSIDIVASIYIEDWWPVDPLPVGISSSLKANGSTFVFDRPRFDPSKHDGCRIFYHESSADVRFLFCETFARISFAPVESPIIKESSPSIKAAYIVCKMILDAYSKTTYQLKTCVLFCMEAFNARNGSQTRNEVDITPKQLAFWVERLMFCFMEFSRHHVYPCYLMPSFRQRTASDNSSSLFLELRSLPSSEVYETDAAKCPRRSLKYSPVFEIYLDLCPDDTAVDIPIFYDKRDFTERLSLNVNRDPMLEQFDREEFIRKLSSRRPIVPAT